MPDPYFTFDELSSLIPDGWLTDALDDDGGVDAEKFDVVLAGATTAVQGYLGIVADSAPAETSFMKRAALLIAAQGCYARRNLSEKFPYDEEYKSVMKTLNKVAEQRIIKIAPTTPVSGVAGAIIEESKTHRRNGDMSL